MSTLRITETQLESVARLQDDPGVLPILRRARLSRNLAFLAAVVQSDEARRGSDAAFRTLIEVQRRAPRAARALLGHPRFGAWAAACADALDGAAPGAAPSPIEHLSGFAAAAAIRARMPVDLEVPAIGGVLVLPTLGALTGATGPTVRIRSRHGQNPLADEPGWHRLRMLDAETSEAGVSLEFDEFPLITTDSATELPSPEPVSETDYALWRERFAEALPLLAATVPELARGLCEGMVSIQPIPAVGPGTRGATLADAFGAAALTRQHDATEAALALLHEFQHSKLSALSELVPLVADDAPDLCSPWRKDPRPASAVLHGAFAHLAMTRVWARLAARPGTRGTTAMRAEAESTRAQTLQACAVLLAESDRLTAAGRRFVALLRVTAEDRSHAPPVSVRPTTDRLEEHRADCWNRRHWRDPAAARPRAWPGPA